MRYVDRPAEVGWVEGGPDVRQPGDGGVGDLISAWLAAELEPVRVMMSQKAWWNSSWVMSTGLFPARGLTWTCGASRGRANLLSGCYGLMRGSSWGLYGETVGR